MANDVFYSNIPMIESTSPIFEKLKEYSNDNSATMYIINRPMGFDSHMDYAYDQAAIFLMPKHKLVFMNYGETNSKDFDHFQEDFLDDLRTLSSKHKYITLLGRPRDWEHLITSCNTSEVSSIEDFLKTTEIAANDDSKSDCRKIELLISLLIGSINDVEALGTGVPETKLEMVKRKIKLFDGMQSRFIYEESPGKRVNIQGLAGTGKTELLLHKLQKTYVSIKGSKIAFTCFNKVLGNDMKMTRIPRFFNSMGVDEQIEWNERLFVFHSWGSSGDPHSGFYSLVCLHYGLNFRRYSSVTNFSDVCKDALNQLSEMDDVEPFFDYMFVDESQDFDESFLKLCECVTKEKVFVAGDIFQNIFDVDIGDGINADYLLNKCYRTDPRTLMFAHAVGMGLYETPVLRWPDDDLWTICGYNKSAKGEKVAINRVPLRRFGDDDLGDIDSIDIRKAQVTKPSLPHYVDQITEIIHEIRNENPSVQPDDIAIVFVSNNNINYDIAPLLRSSVNNQFGWTINEGYATKAQVKGELLLTNANNVKGLEFPFIICLATSGITRHIRRRNSIYMILTRSFLKSYFVVNDTDDIFYNIYAKAAEYINKNSMMLLREPNDSEKEEALNQIRISANERKKSMQEIAEEVFNDYPGLTRGSKDSIISLLAEHFREQAALEEEIRDKARDTIEIFGHKQYA